MPTSYDFTVQQSLSPPDSPSHSANVSHQPVRPPWARSRSSLSRARSNSYSGGSQNFRDQWINRAKQLQRRVVKIIEKMPLYQRVAAVFIMLASLVLTVLFLVYNEKIFEWLEPIAEDWKNLRGGWLIIWALTFITAFPPIIGYSTCITLAGFVYGFPVGWFIVASANIIGSLCSFVLFRTLLSGFARRLTARDSRFAAFSLVLKHDGLKLLVMIRLCPLPYSLSNGAISTIQSVKPLTFALATALASPKLMIHVFIGGRLAAIARNGNTMDATTKAVNYISIIGGMIFGAVTGYLIYQRTVARSQQLEAEERAKINHRTLDLSDPDDLADDLGAYEEHVGAVGDDIDFPDSGLEEEQYRDEFEDDGSETFSNSRAGEDNSISLNKQHPKR